MKRLFALLLFTLILPAGELRAQEVEPSPDFTSKLAAFVRGEWDHGVPYSEARAFGVEALPYLRTWLRTDTLRTHWSTIVWTIGYIGEPKDFATLRSFVEDRFTGEVDSYTYDALLSAVHVLGHIAVKSDEAMDYLRSGTDPSFYHDLKWTYRDARGTTLGLLLSKLAINAVSTSGRPEADQILRDLEQMPYNTSQVSNITEGLARHEQIMREGRSRYFSAVGEPTAR